MPRNMPKSAIPQNFNRESILYRSALASDAISSTCMHTISPEKRASIEDYLLMCSTKLGNMNQSCIEKHLSYTCNCKFHTCPYIYIHGCVYFVALRDSRESVDKTYHGKVPLNKKWKSNQDTPKVAQYSSRWCIKVLQARARAKKLARALGSDPVLAPIFGPGPGPGALQHTVGRITEPLWKICYWLSFIGRIS